MGNYSAITLWQRNGATFTDARYSRAHRWQFDGGVEVPASSSPHVVPVPLSDPAAVDPEEAFIASLSSCHMLTFLYLASKRGIVVEEYRDEAVGQLAKNEAGAMAMTIVTLRPAIRFGPGHQPSAAELQELHHGAHEQCFIANSVKTEVRCEPLGPPVESTASTTER